MGKVLLHIAAIMDGLAVLKISSGRVTAEYLHGGILSPQNIPLAMIVVAIIILTELLTPKRSFKYYTPLFFITSAIFLLCSFFLPPSGEASEELIVLAYAAIIIQFAGAIVIAFSKRLSPLGLLMGIIFAVGVLTLTGFAYTFSDGLTFQSGLNNDAAVVLGASVWGKHKPSPILRGRLEKAIDIYNSGRARKIVVTGGTRRFDTIESEVQAWYLRQRGIPDSAIIVDQNTFCTSEQAGYIRKVLIDSLGMKNIVIVTDDWHLPRALLMCRWEDIPHVRICGAASNYRMYFAKEIYSRIRESGGIQAFLLFGA